MRWIEARWAGATLVGGLILATSVSMPQQPANPAPRPPASTPLPSSSTIPAVPAAAQPVVQPRFVVVIDAAHGGADAGATIAEHVLEKDVTLSLAVRLRSILAARGVTVVTVREADTNVTTLDRAGIANHSVAAACLSLHATTSGSGVHLFNSSLSQMGSQANQTPGRFLPWQSAQSGYITQSLRLASDINSALGHAAIPVILARTSIQPLDSFACPAVAVEIAPLPATSSGSGSALTDAAYQRRVIDAMAAALQQWQEDWRQQP
jgi:N-acetylmuramoyl-L-alanine amidase